MVSGSVLRGGFGSGWFWFGSVLAWVGFGSRNPPNQDPHLGWGLGLDGVRCWGGLGRLFFMGRCVGVCSSRARVRWGWVWCLACVSHGARVAYALLAFGGCLGRRLGPIAVAMIGERRNASEHSAPLYGRLWSRRQCRGSCLFCLVSAPLSPPLICLTSPPLPHCYWFGQGSPLSPALVLGGVIFCTAPPSVRVSPLHWGVPILYKRVPNTKSLYNPYNPYTIAFTPLTTYIALFAIVMVVMGSPSANTPATRLTTILGFI